AYHRDAVVLRVALGDRGDAELMGIGGERAGAGAEDGAAAGHVVELHHALRDVEGMVIGQRDHAGAELDALGAFAGCGQEHLRRSDHFPARGMVLAAPEFVIAEIVELVDEVEVAAELQHRMLADRMMRGEEGSELQARHGCFPVFIVLIFGAYCRACTPSLSMLASAPRQCAGTWQGPPSRGICRQSALS